ncbi:ankyrin repeat-containing protein NPR4-like isoform X1 [Rhododendron vialii]|uniref:ankyrin repeat-containing protein NPR4-like isoform X1 n=1 Tax=Rhododendron vialii TaxID=182163 RepID=UPI00265FA1BB|nr:ankyrin repeat-containing protein NPR4-like isoform X1 [Rhododendron vialii]
MQRELQWFEEVKKLLPPNYIEVRNNAEETAAMVFTREHRDLIVAGQKWMKDTANSCTIAAALIVTIVFAAAITVPGGNYDTGLSIFSKKTAFIAFAVSDAISLFTSTTSLLMFLSILTSRYAESDFLHVLPKRLIIGLFTLFLSITTMIVAFSATLYLAFGHDKLWILIPVAALASLPVTSFVSLQFPLLVDLISSTYGPGIFGKRSDQPFY